MKEEQIQECGLKGCSRFVIRERKHCALHCDKHGDSDFLIEITSVFINELIEYIIEKISYSTNTSELYSQESLISFLKGDGRHKGGVTSETFKQLVIFENIKFPIRVEIDNKNYENFIVFDYVDILNKLGNIEFFKCDFYSNELNVKGPSLHFLNCSFQNTWKVPQYGLLDQCESIFTSCDFKENVYIQQNKLSGYSVPLFKSCIFKGLLSFRNILFANQVFIGERNLTELNEIEIDSCEFKERFILNQVKNKISKIEITSSKFSSKFEIKENIIGLLYINDTNFENIVDFFDTNFDKVIFEKCIINDFVGFEKCEFGNNEGNVEEGKSQFVYTTFKNIPNFRNTKFKNGLDIETANFKDVPNFLKTEIDPQNTNRETFRIIKNSFDRVGNNIEANRFFALEMSKYKEELMASKEKVDKDNLFIFKWNERFSNFGQSYKKPIGWLFLAMALLWILDIGKNNNWLYVFGDKTNGLISTFVGHVNNIAELFMPFKKFLIPGMEMISLIFYIIYLVLIWQIIVAVKRHTKR